jgi:hypothetical protein
MLLEAIEASHAIVESKICEYNVKQNAQICVAEREHQTMSLWSSVTNFRRT